MKTAAPFAVAAAAIVLAFGGLFLLYHPHDRPTATQRERAVLARLTQLNSADARLMTQIAGYSPISSLSSVTIDKGNHDFDNLFVRFSGLESRSLASQQAGKARVDAARLVKKARPVSLRVRIGFDNGYRWLTTVPVHVTARNRTGGTISGSIEIHSPSYDVYSGVPYGPDTVYQTPITVPARGMATVALYMPAWALAYEVQARLVSSGRTEGFGYDDPWQFASTTVTVGVLGSGTPADAWASEARLGGSESARAIPITAPDLVPNPSVLQNLSVIVLDGKAAAALTPEQLSALSQYVHNGGGLILAGPALPPSLRGLVPGTVEPGSASAPIAGLSALLTGAHSPLIGTVSVAELRKPQGTVLADSGADPLVVDQNEGQGHVVYTAFDPAVLASGGKTAALVAGQLLIRANPAGVALGPDWSNENSDLSPSPYFDLPGYDSSDLSNELKNIPSPALGSVILFVVLGALFVLLLGPVTCFVLRSANKLELTWAVLPIGALLSTGATFGVAQLSQSRTAVVNTVGTVVLTPGAQSQSATFYAGLFAPLGGSYHLTYNGQSVPEVIPQPSGASGAVKLSLTENGNSDALLSGMKLWSFRSVAFSGQVQLPGQITYGLHVTPRGYLRGWVRNDTGVSLLQPAVIAGRDYARLPDLPPGKLVPVLVRPRVNIYASQANGQTIWDRIYGSYVSPQSIGLIYDAVPPTRGRSGRGGDLPAANEGDYNCCFGTPVPRERTLRQRIRDAVSQMPAAQTVDAVGQVLFEGWTENALAPLSVDGAAPQRRDLNLILQPLTPSLKTGPFTFDTGTFGPTLVNITPAPPDADSCCSPPVVNAVELGKGGATTYEFSLPDGPKLHLQKLSLYVNASGASGRGMGRLWSWTQHRWLPLDLTSGDAHVKHAQEFVSSAGTVRVKLVTSDPHVDMYFPDPNREVQISGQGWVGK